MKKPVLVAAREIRGGHRTDPKDTTTLKPHVTAPETVVDDKELAQLGLKKDDLPALIANGTLVERQALVSGADSEGHGVLGTTGTEFEGLSTDAMRKTLDEAKVKYPKDASAADLMKIAIEHQAQPTSGGSATGGAAGTGAAGTGGASTGGAGGTAR